MLFLGNTVGNVFHDRTPPMVSETAHEDNALFDSMEGYSVYAATVQRRVTPGLAPGLHGPGKPQLARVTSCTPRCCHSILTRSL